MAEVIPLTSEASNYDQQVVLDGVEYTLTLDWNARANVWMLSMKTIDGDVVILGHPLVVNRPVLRDIPISLGIRPPGELILARIQDGPDIEVDDLGTDDVQLVYYPLPEVIAARAARLTLRTA